MQLGHRRIACWSGPKESLAARERLDGVLETLSAQGLQLMQEHSGSAPSFHADASVGYTKRWLTLPKQSRPTGIVMANDEQAMTFLRMVMDRGINVPGDVSVVGFDGIEEGARFWPGVTTVAQPMHAIGSAAARIVLQMVEGTESQIPEYVEFDTELTVRESTGPAPDTALIEVKNASGGIVGR